MNETMPDREPAQHPRILSAQEDSPFWIGTQNLGRYKVYDKWGNLVNHVFEVNLNTHEAKVYVTSQIGKHVLSSSGVETATVANVRVFDSKLQVYLNDQVPPEKL